MEDVEVRGHIIDSLILPKILDCIMSSGATFRIKEIKIGQARTDPSYARIEIRADDAALLDRVLAQIADHGATPTNAADCRLADGRHRRGLSRRILQHHEPADRGPPGRQVGVPWTTRRWTAASSIDRSRGRPVACP